ncbi:MAG TPA: sigma-70 family RNA polymerase sigma factor [Thermoanaerobaculia bacterium]|nr:sigma-70 family RNA polymerase sigma factor [Thermoanaerobaculia bacterium]
MELFVFDDDYVRRLREGDRDTATHFHAYFRDLLLLKLRRRLGSFDAIDEVRQEVFARCFEHLGDLRDGRKLGAFVNSICNRVLMEYYRAEGRTEPLSDDVMDIPDTSDAAASLDTARNVERVRRVLNTLPARDSDILRAIFIDESSKDEVCRRYGVDRDYLRVLLHRAKATFKSFFLRRKSGRLQIDETFPRNSSLSVERTDESR